MIQGLLALLFSMEIVWLNRLLSPSKDYSYYFLFTIMQTSKALGYKFWSETLTALVLCVYMCGSRGRDRGSGLPRKNHKNVGFLSNTGPDPLKKQTVKPAFNAGPSSARQRNTIYRVFRWRANNGPFQCYLDPLSPYQKKRKKSWTPSGKTFRICAWYTSLEGF